MDNTFTLKKAERKRAKLRIGMSGPSGGGKTYSSLLLARGLASSWDKIAMIDTENRRGDLYSHLGEYKIITLEAPFSPERYISAIKACEDAGMEVIIIDSVSHEWEGKGGCLETNELLGRSKFKGNNWAAWSETTPKHRRFIEAIISSACHVITTVRSKTDTIQTEDKKIKKVGLKEIQREGYEYELTLSLELDRDTHYAIAGKDNTGIFDKLDPFIISIADGEKIKEWNSGGIPDPMNEPATEEQKQQIITMCDELNGNVDTLVNAGAMLPLDRITVAGADKAISGLRIKQENEKNKKNEPPKQDPPQTPPQDDTADVSKKVGPARIERIKVMAKDDGTEEDGLVSYLFAKYDMDLEKLEDMTESEARDLIAKMIKNRADRKETTEKEEPKKEEKTICEKCGKELNKLEIRYLKERKDDGFLDIDPKIDKIYKILCAQCINDMAKFAK